MVHGWRCAVLWGLKYESSVIKGDNPHWKVVFVTIILPYRQLLVQVGFISNHEALDDLLDRTPFL